jgi:Zn-dependent protease
MINFDTIIQTVTVFAIPVLFAISLHEAAHGYAARYFGDPTAANAGRLSLNPAKHIDPFGTILLPLLLYLTIHVPFGYAKPVPVDFNRLRNPKKQMAWVALAGPASNFVMGIGWMVLLALLLRFGVTEPYWFKLARAGVMVNAAIFVFNLIPLPPLDGGRIVTGLLPLPLSIKFARLDQYGIYVFGALVLAMYFGLLDGVLGGAMQGVISFFALLVSPLMPG